MSRAWSFIVTIKDQGDFKLRVSSVQVPTATAEFSVAGPGKIVKEAFDEQESPALWKLVDDPTAKWIGFEFQFVAKTPETSFSLVQWTYFDKRPNNLQAQLIEAFAAEAREPSPRQAASQVIDCATLPHPSGGPWKEGSRGEDTQGRLIECIRDDESIDAWRQLFSDQTILDPSGRLSLKKMAGEVETRLRQNCPSLEFDIRKKSTDKVVYEWSHGQCGSNPPQREFTILQRTAGGVRRLPYATKTVPLTAAELDYWRKELAAVADELQ